MVPKVKKMNKKLVIGLVLISLVGITMIPVGYIASAGDCTEVDFVIWLETPEKQVVIDEMITKTESLGLTVNPIYVTFEEWIGYAHGSKDYDMLYGPYMTLPKNLNILDLAQLSLILNYFALTHTDKKLMTCTDIMWSMFWEAIEDPTLMMDEEFIDKMVDLFHITEKRYYIKQYFSVFVQFETPSSDEWGPVPSMRTEALTFNCLKGRVFKDADLRKEWNSIIDRTVFLDYHALYTPYPVYEVHHIFQYSNFHDITLPNNYLY